MGARKSALQRTSLIGTIADMVDANYHTSFYGEPACPTPGRGESEDGDDNEDALILTGKKLPKIKKDASTRELNEQLALSYAKGKAEYVGELLSLMHKTSKGMRAKTRTKIYDKLFQEYVRSMPKFSEDEIKDRIKQDAEYKMAAIVLEQFDETIGSSDFYNGMNIEMKIAGSKFNRTDVGTEFLKKEVLRKAASLYLKEVAGYGKKYGIDLQFNENKALETSELSKKSADAEASTGYA